MRLLYCHILPVLCFVPGVSGQVSATLGIPYAAPPVGELRWQDPAPVAAGSKAHAAAPDCGMAEDCLYLNVWTAAKTGDTRPVAVLLPAAAGLSSVNGEALAKLGVVVVVGGSRDGLMGFLAHADLPTANFGLADEAAVLEWTAKNISRFGGDPKKIAVVGPHAEFLAATRSIATTKVEPTPLADAQKAGDDFAQSQNAHSIRYLRPMEFADLIRGAEEEKYKPGPVQDGHLTKAVGAVSAPGALQLPAAQLAALLQP